MGGCQDEQCQGGYQKDHWRTFGNEWPEPVFRGALVQAPIFSGARKSCLPSGTPSMRRIEYVVVAWK